MPIHYKTTRYGCQFKCGTRRRNTIKKAEMHEAICWMNPGLKTCRTCKHEVYEEDCCDHPEVPGNPLEVWINRGCKLPEREDHIQSIYDSLKTEGTAHIKPIVNCQSWEGRQS
jgi:hypothetical protein